MSVFKKTEICLLTELTIKYCHILFPDKLCKVLCPWKLFCWFTSFWENWIFEVSLVYSLLFIEMGSWVCMWVSKRKCLRTNTWGLAAFKELEKNKIQLREIITFRKKKDMWTPRLYEACLNLLLVTKEVF